MKIKLLILSEDEKYIKRFCNAIVECYVDKLELFVFSRIDTALDAVNQIRPDICLIDEEYTDQYFELPRNSEMVYFVNNMGVALLNGKRTICKFQMLENIYKNILDIYADKTAATAVLRNGLASKKKIITFFSGAGGVGASTAAAACARYLANCNEKVLYLNLEQTGTADIYFSAEGKYDFSRVIYALVLSNGTTAVKMESSLKQDKTGVYFYSSCSSALDMLELNDEIVKQLFKELGEVSLFDWIVVDMDFRLNDITFEQIERSYSTIFVSDGSDSANTKTERSLNAIETMADQRNSFPLERIFLMYNRFHSKNGKKIKNSAFKEVGGISRYENATVNDLIQLISQNEIFDEIFH